MVKRKTPLFIREKNEIILINDQKIIRHLGMFRALEANIFVSVQLKANLRRFLEREKWGCNIFVTWVLFHKLS